VSKSELFKIILAAVLGVIAKELIAFLLKRTKAASSGIFTWLKNHPRYIGLVIEGMVLAFMIWILCFAGDDSAVATRRDVRLIALGLLVLFGQVEQFGRHVREVRDLYRRQP
jgi:hypothetical protein